MILDTSGCGQFGVDCWALNEDGHIGRVRYRTPVGLYIGDRVDGGPWSGRDIRRIADKDIAILLQEHKLNQNPHLFIEETP